MTLRHLSVPKWRDLSGTGGNFHTTVIYHGVFMALNLENGDVERLAERRVRLLRLLHERIWPSIPKKELGRRLTQAEEDAILGYGKKGV